MTGVRVSTKDSKIEIPDFSIESTSGNFRKYNLLCYSDLPLHAIPLIFFSAGKKVQGIW